jgi:hypothetical protein
MKCLEKDPAGRYQSGELLAQDLGNLREGKTTASQISAMRTGATAPPTIDSEATIPLAGKTSAGAPADTQETVALGSGDKPPENTNEVPLENVARLGEAAPARGSLPPGEVRRKTVQPGGAAPRGSTAAAPEVRAAASASIKPSAPAGASPAPPRVATNIPASRIPPRLQPRPQPRSGNSRWWMIAATVLLVLGVLWGAGIVKKKRDEAAAAASLAAQQEATARAHAAEEARETKKQEAAEQREERADKNAAKEKTPPQPPSKPKIEKAKEEPREEAQPDVSKYALRLEIYAVAPTTVEIQPDDRPAASRLLKVGHKLLVGADKVFLLRTDNAGALKLKMNDQDIADLGPLGAPRTVRLTARDLRATAGAGTKAGGGSAAAQQSGAGEGAAKAAAAAKLLAPRTGQATLQIAVSNMPNFADIVVWVDEKPIFQKKGTGERGFAPITEQRMVAAGSHTLRVFVGSEAAKKGIQKSVSGDFRASQARTLRIETRFRGMPHDASNLGFILTLE